MRSRTLPDLPGRCKRCYLLEAWCLCTHVPSLESRTSVLILRHYLEAPKSTNTARLAALALQRCELFDFQEPTAELDGKLAALPEACVLFPGAPDIRLSFTPRHLVVLDGTWRQARRMMRKIGALSRLPTLSLPPPPHERARLRHSPHAENRSTLEAVADALTLLEGPELGEALLAAHDTLVERTLRSRGLTPSLGLPALASLLQTPAD
ncbi:MAG: tRNA-uridine aminocarboxypropyltransferase [Myxococcaceae bacterium]